MSTSQILGMTDIGYKEIPGSDLMRQNDPVQYPTQFQALHKCENEKSHFYYDQTADTFKNVHCSTLEKFVPKKFV